MLHYNPLRDPDPEQWLESDEAERIAAIEYHHRQLGTRLPNVSAHATIHAVVENQLAAGDPPTVRPALNRLVSQGMDRHEAIHAIGSALSRRMFRALKEMAPAEELNADYERELAAITPESWRAEYGSRMEAPEILQELEKNRGYFPEQAVYQALERPDEFAGPMLRVLEDVLADPDAYAGPSRMIHIYAPVLLAEWRDSRAYPLLVRIFSMPGDTPDRIFGEFITGVLPEALAAVCAGDLTGIKGLIENESADPYVRWSAIDSLLCLVAAGELSRDEAMAYYAGLFQRLPRQPGAVWCGLVGACSDLWPGEVKEEIRRAFDDELVDRSIFNFADFKRALKLGKPAAQEALSEQRSLASRSLVIQMANWGCFSEDEDEDDDFVLDEEEDEDDLLGALESESEPPVETFQRAAPKVGRNDPCPCGSGKKFKKCCGG
jgi:hypothetical protein